MKKLLWLSGFVILGLSACKDDPADDNDNNNPPSNEVTFKGETRAIPKAFTERYGLLDSAQYNIDLSLHNGVLDTNQDELVGTTVYVYFEIATSHEDHIHPGTYPFDLDWGANTFDDGFVVWITGADTNYYFATDGSLQVNSHNNGNYDLDFTLNLENEEDDTDVGIMTGAYNGSSFVYELAPTLVERRGEK